MGKKKQNSEFKLIEAYHKLFPALCLQGKILGASDAMVSDAIHDIFLDLLEKKKVLDNIQNFNAYITIALRRKLSKELKRQFSDLDEKSMDPQKSYESFIIQSEQNKSIRNKLQEAINDLTPSQRKILTLRFYGGLSYEEIANHQGSTVRTVYNQFYSAIKSLRAKKIF